MNIEYLRIKKKNSPVSARACLVLVFLWFFFLFSDLTCANAQEVDEPRIVIGLSTKHISGIVLADAKIAMEIWTKELAARFGIKAEMHFYDDLNLLINDFNTGKIDIGSTAPVDYINIRNRLAEYELAYGNMRGGKKTIRYLLLTNVNTNISNIAQLKGGALAVKRENDLGLVFLNLLLLRNEFEEHNIFFSNIIEKDSFSKIILALFFKEVSLGVVTDLAFNTMKELNPQVGKKLMTLAASPEVAQYISFFRKSYKHKKRIMDAFLQVRDTPRGRQFLTLYKSEGFPPLHESDVKTLESLVHEYNDLKMKN